MLPTGVVFCAAAEHATAGSKRSMTCYKNVFTGVKILFYALQESGLLQLRRIVLIQACILYPVAG